MKFGKSMLIAKYYQTFDDFYDKDILMDYYPFDTLNEHIYGQSESISLQTKLHLIYMTVQGLRYLKKYKIVHLDLKPNNIVVGKNLAIKIIDFGESYHSSFCDKSIYIYQI
jgi:serine/threonine protein kinase